MAIRFDNPTDRLLRTTDLIDYNSPYTVMGWFRLVVDTDNYATFFSLTDNPAQNMDWVGVLGDGTTAAVVVGDAGSFDEGASSTQLTVGVWAHVTMVRVDNSNLVCYVNATPATVVTNNVTGRGAHARFEVGAWSTSNFDPLNARVAALKAWNVALSQSEIEAEMEYYVPVREDDVYAYWPCLPGENRLLDYSGNGRHWTALGTLTDEEGPDIPFSPEPEEPALIEVPFISASTQLYEPTLIGLATIGLPRIDPDTTLYPPTLTPGEVEIEVPFIPPSGEMYSPMLGVPEPYGLRFRGQNSGRIDRVLIPRESPLGTDTPADIGAGDFTIEGWIRCDYDDNDTNGAQDARFSNILVDFDIWGHERGMVLGLTRSGSDLVFIFSIAETGLTWNSIVGNTDVGDDRWHHFAIVRNQSTGLVRLFVDGVLDGSRTFTTGSLEYPDGYDPELGQDNEYIVLGVEKHDVGEGYSGLLDEFRISTSARYSTTFLPELRFTSDENTVVLFHFDQTSGTTVRNSGSGPDGLLLVGGASPSPTWESTADRIGIRVPFIEPTGETFAPTLTLGAVDVSVPLIASSGATYAPTLTPGEVEITVPLISASGAVYDPTLEPGAVSISVPRIEASEQTFEPTLTPDAVTIEAPLIASSAQGFDPLLTSGEAIIAVPFLESIGQLFELTLTSGAVEIEVPFIAPTGQVYEPTLMTVAVSVIEVPFIDAANDLFAPTLTPGAVTISVPMIAASTTLYPPRLGEPSEEAEAGLYINAALPPLFKRLPIHVLFKN